MHTCSFAVSKPTKSFAADKFVAIATNQAARRAALRSSYDTFIV
jgi:hypothetical protein